jgi:hypothetical protein
MDARFRLAKLKAVAESNKAIEDRRKIVDTKTGREVDLSNTPEFKQFKAIEETQNLPKRIQNEYALVLSEMAVNDEKFAKHQTDVQAKAWEEAWQRRQKAQMEFQDEAIHTEAANQSRAFDIASSANDRERDLALQQVGRSMPRLFRKRLLSRIRS